MCGNRLCPYQFVLWHPVHIAVLGGNLKLVKWLVKERYCPLTVQGKTNRGKKSMETPILTNKGRSPLSIAMLHQKMDLVRFLVAEAGVSLFTEKDVTKNLALANFTTVLRMLPDSFFDGKLVKPTAVPQALDHQSSTLGSNQANQRRPSM